MNKSNFYDDYKEARDKAWEVIIKYKISSLPVDVFKLCKSMEIKISPYSKAQKTLQKADLIKNTIGNDGFTFLFKDRYYIFYDDTVTPKDRIRFTIAHEIGHIVLNHLPNEPLTIWNRGEEAEPDEKEAAANIFARDLLAPAGVLHALNIHTSDEIMSLCGLSNLAASYRAKRMEVLYKREADRLSKGLPSCFGLNPKEKTALRQFKKFIYWQ